MLFGQTNLAWSSMITLSQDWKKQKLLQQGSGNTAKKRSGVTSSHEWPHESGHQAVGGVDFSSTRHHLTPVTVYLVWSLADAKWCQHLFVLPLFGSWSFFCLYLDGSQAWSVISSLAHCSVCPSQKFSSSPTTTQLLVLFCVFLAITTRLSLCLSLVLFPHFPSSSFFCCLFTWTNIDFFGSSKRSDVM